jgi:hypothetical protein
MDVRKSSGLGESASMPTKGKKKRLIIRPHMRSTEGSEAEVSGRLDLFLLYYSLIRYHTLFGFSPVSLDTRTEEQEGAHYADERPL